MQLINYNSEKIKVICIKTITICSDTNKMLINVLYFVVFL